MLEMAENEAFGVDIKYAYTESSFKEDIQYAMDFYWDLPPILGAHITAAKKRYKSHYAIDLLLTKKDVDWSPVLANYVIRRCMGRSVSRLLLNDRLGRSERTASEKSPDFDRIDEIVEELLPTFNAWIDLYLEREMTYIVEQFKHKARKSPSENVKEKSKAREKKKKKST